MNLLIVDDIPINLNLLRAQLEAEGHTVFEAHNGVDALALLERQRMDVVISDIFMPEMDGYRLCYEIRKHARLHDLPIILCTSTYTSVEDEKLVRDVRANKYLKRPVSLETIVAAVHEVLAMPHAAPQPKAMQEAEVLMEYSERLVSKLEEKNTELQAQTEALRESVERLRFSVQASNVGLWDWDLRTNQVIYSREWKSQLGYEETEIRNEFSEWERLVHPDDLAAALEHIQRYLARPEGAYEAEYRMRHKDGMWRWIYARGEFFRDASGAAVRMMGCHIDFTERKQADQKFRDLLESAPDAMVIVNRDAEMVLVNAQAVNLFGWRREELLGQKIEILVPERFRGRHPGNRNGFFAQPHARAMGAELELFGLRKDGTEFPVEISLSPLETNEGTLVMSAIRDITARKQADATLRQSEARLQEAQRIARLGNWEWDLTTNTLYWSDEIYRIFELTPQQFGATYPAFLERVHPIDRSRVMAAIDAAVHAAAPYDIEHRIVLSDGRERTVHENGFVFRDETGRSLRMVGTVQDITERKKADDRIVYLNRVYAMLSGINTLMVRVRDRDELFRGACRIAVEEGGFRMAMICMVDRRTMKIVPLASVGKDEALLTTIKDILSSSEGAPNTMIARAIGEKNFLVSNDSQSDSRVLFSKKYAEYGVHSMVVLPLIVSDKAVGVLALYASEIEFFQEDELKLLTQLASDIAFSIDHIEKQERLNYLAYYDVLTGLANRSLFLERVASYMRSAVSGGHKLALYLIDLERFKNINDSLGQSAGDALLSQVAEWLTRNAGDANLLARVGADHFAAVLPEVKQDGEMARLLEKTMAAFLEHPFRLNDAVFRIAAKVGIALFPDDGADADTLFKNAEAALKKAKANGDRYLFYTQTMTETVAGKLTLENQLRQALDNEEFVLHYQPKVNLASGKLTSAEALIRWNDPRTGLVPPGHFIPILEDTGLIHEVGRWALRQAVKDYLRWRAAGLAVVRIAVNVSALQLRHRDFIAEVREAIGIDEKAAAGLELEITESLIMADVQGSIASLAAIRAMGISIAIDDFGTGFSSLSYLAKLPVDTLKIDRSFVIDMTAGPEGLALVSTIISLAHALKLKVVAEGVETEEQSRLLRLIDCDEMQGYLFSKPVPSEIFETRFLVPNLKYSAGDHVENSD